MALPIFFIKLRLCSYSEWQVALFSSSWSSLVTWAAIHLFMKNRSIGGAAIVYVWASSLLKQFASRALQNLLSHLGDFLLPLSIKTKAFYLLKMFKRLLQFLTVSSVASNRTEHLPVVNHPSAPGVSNKSVLPPSVSRVVSSSFLGSVRL